jgi:hypothetical protein
MNQTTQRVLELESKFEHLHDCEVVLTIKAPLKEMEESRKYLNVTHLYHPFENREDQDCYFFRFKSERNKDLEIIVASNELFKRETKIIEI